MKNTNNSLVAKHGNVTSEVTGSIPVCSAEIDPYSPFLAGCMVTVSGKIVNLMNPSHDQIILYDIATGLANNFRWNGHTWPGYSVAQHCCSMHDKASGRALRLDIMFHDSEEAFWDDIIKPVKMILKDKCPELLEKMREMRRVIYSKFAISPHPETKELDDEELRYEWQNLVLNNNLECWTPEQARAEWLSRVNYLFLFVDETTETYDEPTRH